MENIVQTKRLSLNRILLILLCLFDISSLLLFQSFTNKLLMILILITLLLIVILQWNRGVKAFFFSLAIGLIVCIDIYITQGSLINGNDIFYLPLWVAFFLYLEKYEEVFVQEIRTNTLLLKLTVIGWNVLLLFCIVANHNYLQDGLHRLASSAFMTICITWVLERLTGNKLMYLFFILPVVTIFCATSRTYLGMMIILLALIYYIKCNKKRTFFLTIIPLLALVIVIVLNTSIGKRFTDLTVGYFDPLASFTSGRTIFWTGDISSLIQSPFFNILFGSGYNRIYYVNISVFHAEIYAHNDYLNVLFANGSIGLFLYLYSWLSYLRHIKRRYHIEFFLRLILCGIFIMNAVFNGQYNYPAATFSIPFLYFGFYMEQNKSEFVQETKKEKRLSYRAVSNIRDRNCADAMRKTEL